MLIFASTKFGLFVASQQMLAGAMWSLGRFCEPNDVEARVSHILSLAADFVLGQLIGVSELSPNRASFEDFDGKDPRGNLSIDPAH